MAGGRDIDDRVWRALQAKIAKVGAAYTKVGILASKGGQDAHPEGSGHTMIEIAAAHEFGTSAIPQRSFIRRTFVDKQKDVGKMTAQLAKAIVAGRLEIPRALDQLGSWGANLVKRTVTQGEHLPPPLKAETVARKGSTRPLVDKSHMINAVDFESKKG